MFLPVGNIAGFTTISPPSPTGTYLPFKPSIIAANSFETEKLISAKTMELLSIMDDDYKLNIRVGVIFKYLGKALIEIRKDRVGNSVIPGGRVKIGEHSSDALVREIKEEMGIKLDKEKLIYKNTIEEFFTFDNTKYYEIFFVYEYPVDEVFYNKLISVKDNLDNHITEYIFVSPNEFEESVLLPLEIRDIIMK